MNDLPDIALSIRSPWHHGILYAGKDIENRSRRTNFRGSVCIHVSLYNPTEPDIWDYNDTLAAAVSHEDELNTHWLLIEDERIQQRGGIIGVVDIVDCVDRSDSAWFFGPYGYVLQNARPVPFIPCKGALGFFKWKDRVL